jgi:ABC-type antimicrobial peptide transport system permease subunit
VQGAADPDDPDLYMPLSQHPMNDAGLIVRTEKDPAAIIPVLREVLNGIDRDISIYDVTTMQELVQNGTAESRFSAFLMIVFGALALILSAIGIYGVLTFHVMQRTREIGVRLALGASPMTVFRMIFRHALLLTAIGMIAGLFAALAMTGLLRNQLYHVSPNDPLIFTLIPLVLLMVAFVAIVVPARRAMGVEPTTALRME